MSERIKIVLEGGKSVVIKATTLGEVLKEVQEKTAKKDFRLQLVGDKSIVQGESDVLLSALKIKSGSILRVIDAFSLKRRVVPADNSCLFTAVSILCDQSRSSAEQLRSVIADTVSKDPQFWNSAILDGRSAADYATYIQSSKAWGGSIELTILSSHFSVQLVALDVIHLQAVFHPDQTSVDPTWPRAFLLWDGIHYDPVVAGDEMNGRTTFDQSDHEALAVANALAKQAHDDRQFTDTASFSLHCLVCGKGLIGQTDALLHVQATGHSNFGEVSAPSL
mmetsp:Transcript_9451/g.14541  ORF Transcript_9451/g.14541 Transcript_9451/m.14541 type:complete len:279 (-) Transcript_9451:1530-2366(-)